MADQNSTPQESLTDQALAEIAARVDAASTGPWTADAYSLEVNGPEMTIYDEGGHEAGDQQFIAHARTDVPVLLAEVRRLRVQIASERRLVKADDDSEHRDAKILTE